MSYCAKCGAPFMRGVTHICHNTFLRTYGDPAEVFQPVATFPLLTEERVREIVHMEMTLREAKKAAEGMKP